MNKATDGPGNESRGSWELLLELELRRGRLRRSLTEALRTAIQSGRLPATTVLPSSRRLAVDLGVSRGVVTDAYDQLVSEAYLDVKPRFPPVVAAVAAGPPPAAEPSTPKWRFDFSATTPDVGLFPRRVWLRAVDAPCGPHPTPHSTTATPVDGSSSAAPWLPTWRECAACESTRVGSSSRRGSVMHLI